MEFRRIYGFVAAALLLGGLFLLILRLPEKGSPKLQGETISGESARRNRGGGISKEGLNAPAGEEPEDSCRPLSPPDPGLGMQLETLRKKFGQKPDRENALRILQELTENFLVADPDRASSTLLAFLRSGQDLPTGLDFVIGEGGLEEWPSLRAFLLDLLGKINLGMASQYALTSVIPAKKSTVEYAISLRILWNDGGAEEAKPELIQAWLGLLQKTDWSNRPDVAWMESMDFAGRIPAALPAFAQQATIWLADPKQAEGKAEAAQLALERATRNYPVETLETLLGNPGWLSQGRGPAIRATLFARADLSDPKQLQIMEAYLFSLNSASQEATAFAKAFPYRKFSVSPGLSGPPNLQSPEQIRASNLAAEKFFLRIQTQGRHQNLKDKIAQIQNRLAELNSVNY